jgi:polyhydroxybutyrate depolymerase
VPVLATTSDDVAVLDGLLDRMIGDGLADPARVYLCGFSNGAGMTFRYAAHRSERLAAMAPIAGLWWPDGAMPKRPLPTFHLNGALDPLIPIRGGEICIPWGNSLVKRPPIATTLERWATALGNDPRSVIESDSPTHQVESYPGRMPLVSVTVHGLGHHWPGGRGQLNPRIAGPIVTGYDLNPRMLEFFHRHTASSASST